jgi:glycosyltransferase involved in cell wall biosynthesis
LAANGLEVHLASLHALNHKLDNGITFHKLPFGAPWGYFASFIALRRLIARLKPDLMNTHYASGYGTLASLAGCQPNLLSVWGSDVYDFPAKSLLHRSLLKRNLQLSTAIASTSYCMARETAKTYQHQHVFITPFGVDETVFEPAQKPTELKNKLVVGTVKTLKSKYGIDTLIRAFSIAWERLGKPENMMLEITGDGPDREQLEMLAVQLGISEQVVFHGMVSHENVSEMLNRLDIYVALSRLNSESFGVAILEASACELPVIVSDVDGPAEVVIKGVTGDIVPRESPEDAALAICRLITDPDKRLKMGKAGREHVLNHYTWKHSLSLMLDAYKETTVIGKRN